MDPLLIAAAGFLAKGMVEGAIEGSAREAVSALRDGPAQDDKVLSAALTEVDRGNGSAVNVLVLTELIKSHAEADQKFAETLREVFKEATAGQVSDAGTGTSVVSRNEQKNEQRSVFGLQSSKQSNTVQNSPEAGPKE